MLSPLLKTTTSFGSYNTYTNTSVDLYVTPSYVGSLLFVCFSLGSADNLAQNAITLTASDGTVFTELSSTLDTGLVAVFAGYAKTSGQIKISATWSEIASGNVAVVEYIGGLLSSSTTNPFGHAQSNSKTETFTRTISTNKSKIFWVATANSDLPAGLQLCYGANTSGNVKPIFIYDTGNNVYNANDSVVVGTDSTGYHEGSFFGIEVLSYNDAKPYFATDKFHLGQSVQSTDSNQRYFDWLTDTKPINSDPPSYWVETCSDASYLGSTKFYLRDKEAQLQFSSNISRTRGAFHSDSYAPDNGIQEVFAEGYIGSSDTASSVFIPVVVNSTFDTSTRVMSGTGYTAYIRSTTGEITVGTSDTNRAASAQTESAGAAVAVNEKWRIRLRYDGTTVSAKAWKASSSEPAGWQTSYNPSSPTPLAAGNVVGIHGINIGGNGSSVGRYTAFSAGFSGKSALTPEQVNSLVYTATPSSNVAISSGDTGSLSGSELTTTSVVLSSTETGLISATEHTSLVVQASTADAGVFTVTEAVTLVVSVPAADSGIINALESGTVIAKAMLPKAWDGAAWVTGTFKIWDGTSWVVRTPKRWDGTQWVQ